MAKSKIEETKKKLITHFSAGGAVYRLKNNTYEWLIINPAGTSRWQLPKGKIDPGEKSETTAVREVFEETGIKGEIVEKVNTIKYFFRADGEQIFKTVVYYLMSSQGEEPNIDPKWAHEISDVRWATYENALEQLTYKDEKETLKLAQDNLKS